MSYSLYKNEMVKLRCQHFIFKKSLEPIKSVSVNCPETNLMLNKIEEELNETEQRIDAFDNFLLNDTLKLFNICEDSQQSIIKDTFENFYYDLRALASKINDLEEKHVISALLNFSI